MRQLQQKSPANNRLRGFKRHLQAVMALAYDLTTCKGHPATPCAATTAFKRSSG
jgi:hypothetical protein